MPGRRPIFLLLALSLWALSFCLPTLSGKNASHGYQVFLLVFAAFPLAIVGAPLHLLSWATNFLFVGHALRLLRLEKAPQVLKPAIPAAALLLNILVGIAFGTTGDVQGPRSLPGLLTHPGFYVWLSSFLFLVIAALREESLLYANTSAPVEPAA